AVGVPLVVLVDRQLSPVADVDPEVGRSTRQGAEEADGDVLTGARVGVGARALVVPAGRAAAGGECQPARNKGRPRLPKKTHVSSCTRSAPRSSARQTSRRPEGQRGNTRCN